jgi:predicted ATPase
VIGLTGAQRTGKTTLAQAFAQKHNIPFVKTETSSVFKALELDPKVEYPIEIRTSIQDVILQTMERQYLYAQKQASLFIADRTPIDMAAYMLADIQRSTLAGNPELAKFILEYVGRCIDATNRYFSVVCVIQPGIQLVEAEGKAPACPAFMEHFNAIALGLMVDERLNSRHFLLPRRYVLLEQRIKALEHTVVNSVENHEKALLYSGAVVH